MTDKTLHICLGNQLFPIEYLKKHKIKSVFMREDMGLCTYERHHKHKIILLNEFVLFLVFLDLNKSEFLYQLMQLQELEKKKKIHDQAAFSINCKIKIELNLSPTLKETIAIIRYKIGQTIPNI